MKDFALCLGAEFSRKATWGVLAAETRGADLRAVCAKARPSALDAPSFGKRRAKRHSRQAGADHAAIEVRVIGHLRRIRRFSLTANYGS